MASQETLALAEHYLQKHAVPEDQFGLGPFLDSGKYTLFAGPQAMLDGSMRLRADEGNILECRSISEAIYADILANNPELNPKIMWYTNNGTHNWVEITDPKTGQAIQIDATPWYAKLNPGHIGTEAPKHKPVKMAYLAKNQFRPFSVKRLDGGRFISTYICGFLPNCLYELTGASAAQTGGNIRLRASQPPKYTFVLQAVLEEGFSTGKPENFTHVYIDVLDSARLEAAIRIAKTIDELIAQGIVSIGFMFGYDTKISCTSVEFMRMLAEKGKDADLISEVERNLPRIMLLLKQTGVSIPIYGSEEMLDAKTCRPIDKMTVFMRTMNAAMATSNNSLVLPDPAGYKEILAAFDRRSTGAGGQIIKPPRKEISVRTG